MSGDRMGDDATQSVGNGRYVLRDLLGQGGMAAVHLAHDTVLDRPVAVKTLHSDLGREQSFRERFRREAQAVARLNHTNIVSVYDSGEDTADGAVVPYIVMEFVQGRPLRDLLDDDISQYGAMPAKRALEIVSDVLAALSESHGMGLVHRDIKPGNVMVTKRGGGTVKVMDFGIARAMQSGVSSMTQTGMVVGTPHYLSPEQALGRQVDERSDLYSVGCLLFELLTGRLPFDGDSPLAIAYQHVQEPAPVPSQFNRALTPAVDALVGRALRKNPAERFQTAEAMREEVLRLAAADTGALPATSGVAPQAAGGGAGVASAVFPPVTAGTGPGPVQTPPPVTQGQVGPGPFQTPPPQTQGQVRPGPATPVPGPLTPPVAQSYQQAAPPVYQQPAPQYHTPQPRPGYGFPQHTPPPVATPVRREGRGARRTAVVVMVFAAVAFVLFLVLIVVAVIQDGTGTTGGATGGASSTPTVSVPATTVATASVVQGDSTDVVSTSSCTQASESYVHPGSVFIPDFYGKYIDSVKNCMAAAGWSYTVKYENETLFGKGTVVKQNPDIYFNPQTQTVTVWVSTGLAS